jgi:hypothetical protein
MALTPRLPVLDNDGVASNKNDRLGVGMEDG